jgi:hypothetical protein
MNRKILLFIGLSVLVMLAGVPLLPRQNRQQFPDTFSDTIKNVEIFDEQGDISLQRALADSARVLFQLPSHTCSCLEPDFSEGIKRLMEDIGESKVLVVIAVDDSRDIFFFRERNYCHAMFTAQQIHCSPAYRHYSFLVWHSLRRYVARRETLSATPLPQT